MSRPPTEPTKSEPFRLSAQPNETEMVAKYFRGLGDPTRIRILELLSEREHSVGELTRVLDVSQSKVSNHLACLRWCGFVDSRREHRLVHYRISDPRVRQVVELGHELLAENAEHVQACRRIDGPAG